MSPSPMCPSECLDSKCVCILNAMPSNVFLDCMRAICHAETFARTMLAARPFPSNTSEALFRYADVAWDAVPKQERLCAFAAHPRIGQVIPSNPVSSAHSPHTCIQTSTRKSTNEPPPEATDTLCSVTNDHKSNRRFLTWSKSEQSNVDSSNSDIKSRLADANDRYYSKFHFIFIVCATGKSASQILQLLETRLENDPETELSIAAEEQRKIIHIRLEKLIQDPPSIP